jgi:hypothetical protein
MIDMAQADRTLRTRTTPVVRDWNTTQPTPAGIVRGDRCVIRGSGGTPEILKIEDQRAYTEWVGCFSII